MLLSVQTINQTVKHGGGGIMVWGVCAYMDLD